MESALQQINLLIDHLVGAIPFIASSACAREGGSDAEMARCSPTNTYALTEILGDKRNAARKRR